jgi:hypothetical protein
MVINEWHPVQLGLFLLLIAVFGLPVWVGLTLGASALANLYPYQDWFEAIPIAMAFLVVFLVVGFGSAVTMRWLDGRSAKPQ